MFSQNCEHAYTVKDVTINVNSKLSTNYICFEQLK